MLNKTIKISRSKFIEDNIEIALIRMKNAQHYVGQPIMVRYYSDSMKTQIDTLFAIGVKDGTGEDCFKMISIKGLSLINGITYKIEDLPDVSALVHGELYLSWVNNEWNYVYEVDNQRIIEPIIGDSYAYVNTEDKYTWFFNNGVLKREDDFYSKGEIDSLLKDIMSTIEKIKSDLLKLEKEVENHLEWLKKLDKELFPLKLNISFPEGNVFLKGSIVNVKLNITGEKDGNPLETNEFDIFINDSPVLLDDNGDTIIPNLNSTTELNILGVYKKTEIPSKINTVTIYFENYTYLGIVSEDWTLDQENPIEENFNKILRYKSDLEITNNLSLEKIILIYPSSFGKIKSIIDENSLEYINEYITYPEVEIDGELYNIYEKKIAITMENFKQIFKYNGN